MSTVAKKPAIFVPGPNKRVVPFMRDVFTIPKGPREKPRLIGSVCPECEEYFFPKTGAKATCDNPLCPRSTSEVLLSGRGRLLSATVTRSSVEGDEERASAVILLEEGIKINSPLVGWEGFRDLLVPGTQVELVLQEMGKDEAGKTLAGYAFRLVTGRRKPKFPPVEKEKEKKLAGARATAKGGEPLAAGAERAASPPREGKLSRTAKKKAAPRSAAGPRPRARKAAKRAKPSKSLSARKKAAKRRPAKKKKKVPARKAASKRAAVRKVRARKSAASRRAAAQRKKKRAAARKSARGPVRAKRQSARRPTGARAKKRAKKTVKRSSTRRPSARKKAPRARRPKRR